jgi:hypothetical protein
MCMWQLYAEGATWFIISTTVDDVAIIFNLTRRLYVLVAITASTVYYV